MRQWMVGTLLMALGATAWCETPAVTVQNPSFEQGTNGFWVSAPALARLDTETSSHGLQSLCLDLPAQKTVSTVQFIPNRPGMTYHLALDVKGDPGTELQVRLMLQGDRKPIVFWLPPGHKAAEFNVTPTAAWKRVEFAFGPLPVKGQGKAVQKVGFYLNSVSGSQPGKVWLDHLVFTATGTQTEAVIPYSPEKKPAPAEKQSATAEKKPASSVKKTTAAASVPASPSPLTIELPNPVQLYEHPVTFKVTVKAPSPGATLRVTAVNARGRKVLTRQGPATAGLSGSLSGTGYYDLTAELEQNGKTVASRSTSLMITTPLPSDYYATPGPAFGVWGLPPDLLRYGGAKWTRQLFFTIFQKKDAKAEPPSPEKIRQRSPIKVIRCLNILNPFKRMVPVPAADWPEIREKVTKELISNRGLADVWETQNEWMVGENFHGQMQDVVTIITETSRLVRQLTPGARLAGICINPMSLNQYGQIVGYYRNFGMERLVDGVMLHPYIPNAAAPDSAGYIETLNRLARDLNAITGKNIPLYISEIGYSTQPGGEVTELEQAAYLARVMLLNYQVPTLQACVWHIGLWNDATSRRELDYGILRGYPKKSLIREPKPAFAAWAAASRLLYRAEYKGELEFGRGVRVLLFARQGRPLLAAYSLSGRPQPLKIPFGGKQVTVTDVCGETSVLPINRGLVAVTVDAAPIYLAGTDAGDLARLLGRKIEFTPDSLRAQPGEAMTVALHGALLAAPGAALRVETPDGWQTAVSGQGDRRQVKLTVPGDAAPGDATLFFHLVSNGESRSIWRRDFQVLPPVELQQIAVRRQSGGGQELSFLPAGAGRTGTLSVQIKEDKQVLTSASGSVNHPVTVALPKLAFGRPHAYTAALTLGNCSWSVPLPVLNQFPVAKVTADTAASAWPSVSTFSLADGTYSQHSVLGEFDRPEGQLHLGWTAQGLELLLTCHDRWLVPPASADSLWQGDSLQLGFSVDPAEMVRPNNDGIQETSYAEFGIMPGENGQCQSMVWASTNRTLMELGKPLPGLRATWTRQGEITTYRIELPWSALNVKNPRSGLRFKFSLLVNDCDQKVDKRPQRHWLEWYGGIADGKNPALYGSGVLTP